MTETKNGTNQEVKKVNIFENAVAASLTLKKPGNIRKVSSDLVETDASKELLSLQKQLISGDKFKNISKLDDALKHWMRVQALPVPQFRVGVFLVPLGLLEKIEEMFAQYKERREILIDDLMQAREELIDRAREELGSLFREADYIPADEYRSAFSADISYLSFQTPTELKNFDSDLFKRESAKLKETWENTTQELMTLLREDFKDFVANLRSKLTDIDAQSNGKRKVFRKSVISNLREFCDTFSQGRNITNDEELNALVQEVKAMLGENGRGVSVEMLRADKSLRQGLKSDLDNVIKNADGLVKDAPRRKFRLTD